MQDWIDQHLKSNVQEIRLSKTDLWQVTEQSCDCDSVILRTEEELLLLTYRPEPTGDALSSVSFSVITEYDATEFAYCVDLGGEIPTFVRAEFLDNGNVEGLKFRVGDAYLFLFASPDNLIVTKSIYDIFEDEDMDFPDREAKLEIHLREANT